MIHWSLIVVFIIFILLFTQVIKSNYESSRCKPKKKIKYASEYKKDKNGTCRVSTCEHGYTPSKDLTKCTKSIRKPPQLKKCSTNFQINKTEYCFIKDSNTTGDYSDAGIKWSWSGDQSECYNSVNYYIVDVYGKSNPEYKLAIKITDGRKMSVGFTDIWYKFMKDGIVFTVTPYDNDDLPMTEPDTIELNQENNTDPGEDLGIDMLPVHEWFYNQNIASIQFVQWDAGNQFGYTIWEDTGETLINYGRDHVGVRQSKYSVIPKGGKYGVYCEAPSTKTDWFSMTWDEMRAKGSQNVWFQKNTCYAGDALKGNSNGPDRPYDYNKHF